MTSDKDNLNMCFHQKQPFRLPYDIRDREQHIVVMTAYILRPSCSAGFQHSLSRGSLMTTYITLLALFVEHSWCTNREGTLFS